ncbi:phosphate signaling complex protein PhoU [Myceligenerans xiligouense]|uniref:Phosphate-specific transport system accessory protein PhoU n=1 Tax=Myceligenerans xiligouense TaxID=253184 RepID=A0A3N4Z3R9_9MICO|nr:phosphate signaling complex protein PhoU [Myceligenerans xiligouense]RPF19792.1 PhoU-like phosphate uptake regulator [Myceligenerans xiligouense]
MRQIFEAELRQVGDDLAEMSRLVESAITKAGKALREADLQLAQEVIASDKTIDQLEASLDERCVHLLAQQAPVATDLRVIVSALRMSASLERMGDLARHVAQVARGRYPAKAIVPAAADIFAKMDEAAVHVAERTTRLLESRDLEMAQAIERDDDLLDELHQETFGALLGDEWDGTVQEAVDITLVGRYYERFGDHGVSIAKRVSFLVTGDFPEDHQQP